MNSIKNENIRYFKEISPNIWTSGQPNEEQLSKMKAFNVEAVINLALPSSDWAVTNEADIITKQGIIYIHIPVDFNNPKIEEFELFSVILDNLNNRKKLIHCALNMRVSVFNYIYQVKNKFMSLSEARENLYDIWIPDVIWQSFIDDIISDI